MGRLVHQAKKTLCQLIHFTLANLIGLRGNLYAMPAFRPNGDFYRAHGATEDTPSIASLDCLETASKISLGFREHLVGRNRRSMKVAHASQPAFVNIKRRTHRNGAARKRNTATAMSRDLRTIVLVILDT